MEKDHSLYIKTDRSTLSVTIRRKVPHLATISRPFVVPSTADVPHSVLLMLQVLSAWAPVGHNVHF